MKVQEPMPHWNNFTVSELKDILEHCSALENLGIAQDEEMMVSIETDIVLREKKIGVPHAAFKPKPAKLKQKIHNYNRTKKIIRKTAHDTNHKPDDYLLEQTV